MEVRLGFLGFGVVVYLEKRVVYIGKDLMCNSLLLLLFFLKTSTSKSTITTASSPTITYSILSPLIIHFQKILDTIL